MDNFDDTLSQLTLEQKAGLVCGKGDFTSAGLEEFDIPALEFCDGPQGLRKQKKNADHLGLASSLPATCFPVLGMLACSWDRKLAYRVGKALGEEAAAQGVDVLLAPSINLIRHPLGGRNFEYFSEDPVLTAVLASQMVRGIQKSVSACLKHFLLNSQETFRMSVDERASSQTICTWNAAAFERVIREARPDWVMTSYNRVNGEYVSESRRLLQDLLKTRFGFDGAVVTDWGGGNDIVGAVKAGCTLEMPSTGGQSALAIVEAVKSGVLDEKDLDDRVQEYLKAVQKAEERKQKPKPNVSLQMNFRLAVSAAEKSAVLLENRNRILPLGQEQKIAWIGPFGSDFPVAPAGSGKVRPAVRSDFRKELKKVRKRNGLDFFARGYRLKDKEPSLSLEKKALEALSKADAAVFLASACEQENMEGIDRRLTDLPAAQQHLLTKLMETGKPVIVVDTIIGALNFTECRKADALLYLGLSGQGTPEALVHLLFGKVSPSGHLPFTVADNLKDYPVSGPYPEKRPLSWHLEGNLNGYRYFCSSRIPVLYPFGYGLTYTQFSAFDFEIRPDGVYFSVANTGTHKAAAVYQLYIRKKTETGWSAPLLQDFSRTQLSPRETKEAVLHFDEYTFRTWQPQSERFAVLKGEYEVIVAEDAEKPVFRQDYFLNWGEEAEQETAAHLYTPFREPEWPLDLQTPLECFKDAPNPTAARMIKALIRKRDRLIEKNQASPVLIAALDMPLKSYCKLYPSIMSYPKAERLLQIMKDPYLSETETVIALLKLLNPVLNKEKESASDEVSDRTVFTEIRQSDGGKRR